MSVTVPTQAAVIFRVAPARQPRPPCIASHRAAPVHAHFDHAHRPASQALFHPSHISVTHSLTHTSELNSLDTWQIRHVLGLDKVLYCETCTYFYAAYVSLYVCILFRHYYEYVVIFLYIFMSMWQPF